MSETRFVELELNTIVSQVEMNRLLDHLKEIEDFEFILRAEVYTSKFKPIKKSEVVEDIVNDIRGGIFPFESIPIEH